MMPLRFVETERENFDEPVIELWRADEFVGMVFWDGEAAIAQVYPDDGGEIYDLGLAELVRVLDLAEQIVTPEEFRTSPPAGIDLDEADSTDNGNDWSEEHPATLALVREFDPSALHRSDEGEGFFARPVALDFIARCDELDLAVVEMEAFDLEHGDLKARPNLVLNVSLPGVYDWGIFRPTGNALARDTLVGWPARDTLVVAFVVQQPDGETFVA